MAHWNTKKRADDKRGHREWTDSEKEKVRISSTKHPLLSDKAWLEEQYLVQKKTTVQIAQELGCVCSSVFVALGRLNIPRRDRLAAAKRGSEHHLWRGGNGFRGDQRYAEWRTMVYGRDNFTCQMCEARGCYLHAHHILPCRSYPDLIYVVSNGMTLCVLCHEKTYNREIEMADELRSIMKNRMNSVNPKRKDVGNTEPSCVESQKVHRLLE